MTANCCTDNSSYATVSEVFREQIAPNRMILLLFVAILFERLVSLKEYRYNRKMRIMKESEALRPCGMESIPIKSLTVTSTSVEWDVGYIHQLLYVHPTVDAKQLTCDGTNASTKGQILSHAPDHRDIMQDATTAPLYVYLSIHRSINLFICTYIYLATTSINHLFNYISIYQSFCLSTYLYICY